MDSKDLVLVRCYFGDNKLIDCAKCDEFERCRVLTNAIKMLKV